MPIAQFGARTLSRTILVMTLGFVVVWSTGCAGSPETLSDGTGEAAHSASAAESVSSAGAAAADAIPACATPSEGCPCTDDGAQIACPGPKVRTGNYTTCADGVRACTSGQWGACITATVVQSADQVSQDDSSPCPAGTAVQWGALSLDGLTPGNSNIAVTAQTAATQAGLDAAPAVALGTFSGSQNTSWTSANAQAAFAGAGVSSDAWVRVTLTLTAATTGGSTPMVAEWREASTCVAVP